MIVSSGQQIDGEGDAPPFSPSYIAYPPLCSSPDTHLVLGDPCPRATLAASLECGERRLPLCFQAAHCGRQDAFPPIGAGAETQRLSLSLAREEKEKGEGKEAAVIVVAVAAAAAAAAAVVVSARVLRVPGVPAARSVSAGSKQRMKHLRLVVIVADGWQGR